MVAKRHISRGPSIEEDPGVDCAASTLSVADGPVLLERLSAVNGTKRLYQ